MLKLIRHVLLRHSLPALLIVLIVLFGFSTNRALAPVPLESLVAEETVNEPTILAQREGPALFDIRVGPVVAEKEKRQKVIPFIAFGLILLVSITYTLIYKKIHGKDV